MHVPRSSIYRARSDLTPHPHLKHGHGSLLFHRYHGSSHQPLQHLYHRSLMTSSSSSSPHNIQYYENISRNAFQSLLEQERSAIADRVGMPGFVLDENWIIQGFNAAVEEKLGYNIYDLANQDASKILLLQDKDPSFLNELAQNHSTGKLMAKTKDGNINMWTICASLNTAENKYCYTVLLIS
eukprot:gb/GECH01002994.1/.p1 GENE.gb/GECH01002994.1/~~gb/GECH01002994.1/.p1  ORF type:complete len:183 (+),score=37.63 gb/GECH01002994.1/:1-549(+)